MGKEAVSMELQERDDMAKLIGEVCALIPRKKEEENDKEAKQYVTCASDLYIRQIHNKISVQIDMHHTRGK